MACGFCSQGRHAACQRLQRLCKVQRLHRCWGRKQARQGRCSARRSRRSARQSRRFARQSRRRRCLEARSTGPRWGLHEEHAHAYINRAPWHAGKASRHRAQQGLPCAFCMGVSQQNECLCLKGCSGIRTSRVVAAAAGWPVVVGGVVVGGVVIVLAAVRVVAAAGCSRHITKGFRQSIAGSIV